jgi:hypothetical protein
MRTVWLNGWQRLWVVVGIVSLVLAVGVVWDLQPTREEIYQQWASDEWGEIQKIPSLSNKQWWELKAELKEPTDSAIIARLNWNAKSRLDSLRSKPLPDSALMRALEHANTIRPDYEKRLASFAQARAIYWARVVGRWAGFMALLYLAGWSVGRIYRGFRRT